MKQAVQDVAYSDGCSRCAIALCSRDSRAARVYLPLQLVSLLPPLNSALHEVGCTGHGMLRWLLLMRCSLDPQSGLFQVGLDVTILRY
jgi:hypothetical protein